MFKAILAIIIFLASVFIMPFYVRAQNTPQVTGSFLPSSVTAAANAEFTVDVRVVANPTIEAQVLSINVSFDTARLELKGITYSDTWEQSTNLGGDGNNDIAAINNRLSPAEIRLIGEKQSATGKTLTAGQPIPVASLTFKVKQAQQTELTLASTSTIIQVKPDTSLQILPVAATTLVVNQGGATSPSPGTVTCSFAPQQPGLIPTDDYDNGLRIYTSAVGQAVLRATTTPNDATVAQPPAVSLNPPTAPGFAFSPIAGQTNAWSATIPRNPSTTVDNFYTVTGTATLTGSTSADCTPFIIKVPKANTLVCSGFTPSGTKITDTGDVNDQGMKIYKTNDSSGGSASLTITTAPAGATLNQPTSSPVPSASPLTFSGSSGNWRVTAQANNSTTDVDYVVNGRVTGSGQTVDCPSFVLRVPGNTVCSENTQARLRINSQDSWSTNKTIVRGQSIEVAGFHRNRTTLPAASDTILVSTGPEDGTSQDENLTNLNSNTRVATYTPAQSGRYTITAAVAGKSGDNCTGVAELTVQDPAVVTRSFRIAENPSDFRDTAYNPDTNPHGWQAYTAHPMPYDYTFKNITPGPKFIFVEFRDSTGKVERKSAQIKLLGNGPAVTGCSLSFEGNNTILNLAGTDFGSAKGTAKTGEDSLQVKNWKNNAVQVVWPNAPTGETLPVTITNPDGQSAEGSCNAAAQLAVGAKVFCRQPAQHQTTDVELILVKNMVGSQKIKQKVSLDKNGLIQGLNQKLETGQQYILSLKAPKTLRKNIEFTAEDGTTNIPNFVLPVGDIFPTDGGDGAINSADYAELIREWTTAGDATGKLGDFNVDGKINSVDWACMRSSFGSSEDSEPTPKGPVVTPRPSVEQVATSSATPVASMSAVINSDVTQATTSATGQ